MDRRFTKCLVCCLNILAAPGRGPRPWGGPGTGAAAAAAPERTTRGTRSRRACCGWFPSLRGCKGRGSSHGRDEGTCPLPPPLGLEGFAFHRAPGWGRWAAGSGRSCTRRGGPGEPGSLGTRPAGGLASGTSAGPGWRPTARCGRPPSLSHHLSPQPASFSVSATGWPAGEGSEARYSRGTGRGRGRHHLPALLRRRRRSERGAAGRRRGWVGASQSLTKGN